MKSIKGGTEGDTADSRCTNCTTCDDSHCECPNTVDPEYCCSTTNWITCNS